MSPRSPLENHLGDLLYRARVTERVIGHEDKKPASSAICTMASPSAMVRANGFSMSTCLPAARAAWAIAACVPAGVAMAIP